MATCFSLKLKRNLFFILGLIWILSKLLLITLMISRMVFLNKHVAAPLLPSLHHTNPVVNFQHIFPIQSGQSASQPSWKTKKLIFETCVEVYLKFFLRSQNLKYPDA